jgi:hypothetical protein
MFERSHMISVADAMKELAEYACNRRASNLPRQMRRPEGAHGVPQAVVAADFNSMRRYARCLSGCGDSSSH